MLLKLHDVWVPGGASVTRSDLKRRQPNQCPLAPFVAAPFTLVPSVPGWLMLSNLWLPLTGAPL